MKKINAYIAINSHRTSTNDGFSNTWTTYRCTPTLRKKLLTEGLPVRDVCGMDRTPFCSTMGIRPATPAEIRELKKEESRTSCEIEAYEAEIEGETSILFTH